MQATLRRPLFLMAATWAARPALARSTEPGWDFRCPPARLEVERSAEASSLVFWGTDTRSPLVCSTGPSGAVPRVLGLWRLEQPSVQAALEPLRALFPARPGMVVRVHYFRHATDGQMAGHFQDVWRVVRRERITVQAGVFETMLFERTTLSLSTGAGRFNRVVRFWLDLQTGAPLRLEHTPVGGRIDPDVRTWEATRLRLPPGHRPR
jgi:hypothetical protein